MQELKAEFRKESDALAFHLRLNGGNFQDQALVRGYLSAQFGEGSSALSSYERTLATNSRSTLRTEAEQSGFTEEATNQIQHYINSADGYDSSTDYVSFLESEFNSYLDADLEDPKNLGVALWLAMYVETVDFVLENGDLLVAGSSSARVDGWLGDWWDKNKTCVTGAVGSYIMGSLTGCGVGAGIGGSVGSVPGVIIGCYLGSYVGAVGGTLMGYATFCNRE